MLSVQEMRKAIKNAPKYKHSGRWHERVDHMPEKQVMAIYFRMLKDGELQDVRVQYR